MDRASDPPRATTPSWVRAGLALATLMVLALGTWAALSPLGSDASGATLGPAWIGLLFVALALMIAVLAALLGGTLMRSRLAPELRRARSERQALAGLLDVWQWQTNAEHVLVRLVPPHDAPATAWASASPPSGQTLWDRYASDNDDPDTLRSRLQAHAPLTDMPALHQEPGGGALTKWVLRGLPLFDADGRFSGYIGTARELIAAPPAAVEAAPPPRGMAQFSDQEAFSYTVSHDLRAPIRVVEGFTRIVKEDYGRVLDRIGIDHLDRVLSAAARMNSMIDALLNLSQLSSQPLAHQPVNLSQLASYVVDDLRRNSPEREVEVHIQSGLATHGDPTLLRMALENLLGNAWKYTARTPDAQIWFEAGTIGQPHCFTLRDNGAGFDMRFADRLFGVFQRLHSASEFQGTGVGLASVRRIVRRHGGEIWAESEVGRGAAFHFTLRT